MCFSPNRGSFATLTKKGKVIFFLGGGQNKDKFDAISHHMDSNVLSVYFDKNNQFNAIKLDGVRITLGGDRFEAVRGIKPIFHLVNRIL
ncbi:hypothetical protein [Vibrio jasicida]|uniref:hypothetical protein n=1 Tax=Vibrio jasicida TaxID=766224 RepID=UPI000CE49D78|nr:hypothetical protein [Vibrio jasicida]